MDEISEQRLQPCHPGLVEKVRAAAALCENQGVYVWVTSGLRTYAEQDVLFFACHHPDGTRDFTKKWLTNARGGYSNHNFGMAIDCAPSLNGLSRPFDPDWVEASASWQIVIREMKAQGLAWGGDWKTRDNDHFQRSDMPVTPTGEDRTLFAQGGLPTVWQFYNDGSNAATNNAAGKSLRARQHEIGYHRQSSARS